MTFEGNEEKIRYLFEGEDVFGYYISGYNGEWLTALDWLSLTKESRFPAVPPNIYRLLSNERVGDIVIVINPPKIPIFWLRYPANHAGVTDTGLMMPILLKGPQLEHLYEREEMWNFGFRYDDDIYRSWLEYDLYSSYLIRLWTGAGLQYNGQNLDALVQARLQIDLGKIQLNYGGQFTQEGWEINTKEVVYQINDRLALEWLIPNGFSMSFSW